MKPKAIAQAEQRLSKAAEAFERLKASQNFSDAERAWSDFLIAANTIYSKLELGSKCNGRSKAWFGRVKNARKNDPLLSYLHQARHCDEHSIEDITNRNPGGWGIQGDFILNGTIGGPGSVLHVTGTNPVNPPSIVIEPSRLELVLVTNRGKVFVPPTEHLGCPIVDKGPQHIAELGIAYLRALIEEARQFVIAA